MNPCICTRCKGHLAVLGLRGPQSSQAISRSYRGLVKVWHPDRFESDARLRLKAEDEFKRIQEAYNGLREHLARPAEVLRRPALQTSATADYRGQSPVLFSVSPFKLALLSVCTLGLYQFYWFYQNWSKLRAVTGKPYLPLVRAVFSIAYCRSCFQGIRRTGVILAVKRPPSAGLLGAMWFLTQLAWLLPDPYWLIVFSSFVYMLPMQAYAAKINAREAPDHDRNSRLTAWNWLTVFGGGIYFALVLIATFTPDQK